MVRIGRLRINNFKSFYDVVDFDFSERDLVLFDGPNGFGKTTVFDAIELCLTGQISRVKKTDSKVKKDHILKGDNDRITSIILELLNEDGTLLVIEAFIPCGISGEDGKVKNYKNQIKRYEYSNWESATDKSSTTTHLNVKKLYDDLGNSKLESTFSIFNYIQQEDTCHFLKLDEDKRHKEISHLFGTTNETNRHIKLLSISDKINEEILACQDKIRLKNKELEALSRYKIDDDSPESLSLTETISLLPDLTVCTIEQLNEYRSNLEAAKWISSNSEDFLNKKHNHLVNIMLFERVVELQNLIKVGSLENYSKVEKFERSYARWKKAKRKLAKYDAIISKFESNPNSVTVEILESLKEVFLIQHGDFSSDINNFNLLNDRCDSSKNLISKIIESRKDLIDYYDQHIDEKEISKDEELSCPLCGDPKSNWKGLIQEYEEQEAIFSSLLDKDQKALEEVSQRLIEDFITPLINKMKRYKGKYHKYLTFDFETLYEVKSIGRDEFDKMVKVRRWLNDNISGASDFIDEKVTKVNQDYEGTKQALCSLIGKSFKPMLSEQEKDYNTLSKDIKALNLEVDLAGTLNVHIDELNSELLILERMIVQKSAKSYRSKEQEISKLELIRDKLIKKKDEIKAVATIYKNSIKAYEKEVAKHIAIPLFVYSSKILQSRPEGSGVFLVTPTSGSTNGFMQFSATASDSHDAWNTMSSGQLSGLIISFMLAMNKVYPTKLDTLMIDDPVQTMDEVNMASFVQMMKYEFPLAQLLLSTHEPKVANYITYKYNNAGLETQPINMKNIRFKTN